ncbi:hypothetical protein L3X38_042752 [Prunus dulcis]|uniref:Uncharacterized protein n=1 Tax=Prunus dulcis TaxID=3755 RepID=A0AAD4UX82_PRUDU|nr:hypothetical protein L3X38_042752 [Prunus dulcis]
MLTFDLQTVKAKLATRNDVLKILQKTPFWSIIKAYMEAADNEKEEEATKTDHADHEEQEENEEDDDFVITLKDWLKSQTQKGKKQTVITQKQNFSFY